MENKNAVDLLNKMTANTLMERLNIEFTKYENGELHARMPVNEHVHQPFGLLHGGASAALAESVGSAASLLKLNNDQKVPLAVEINSHHLRSVSSGFVYAKASLLNNSKRTHVWDIEIVNENGEKISVSRLVMVIVDSKQK